MRFREVWLQLQSTLGQSARFFATRRRGIECVNNPAFQLRVAGDCKREVWIQVESTLEKLLALFQFFEILKSAGKIVPLDKSEIGLAIFCWLVFELCFFARRQFCLQLARERARQKEQSHCEQSRHA